MTHAHAAGEADTAMNEKQEDAREWMISLMPEEELKTISETSPIDFVFYQVTNVIGWIKADQEWIKHAGYDEKNCQHVGNEKCEQAWHQAFIDTRREVKAEVLRRFGVELPPPRPH